MPEAVRTVEHTMERVALRTLPRIPVDARVVAVQVGVVLIVVRRAYADDDAVADVGADATRVRVIRRADPVERRIVTILVVIDLFPLARHGPRERIAWVYRLQQRARRFERADRHGGSGAEELQELASRDGLHVSAPSLLENQVLPDGHGLLAVAVAEVAI